MIKINTLHPKDSDCLYDLDCSKQSKVKGGLFSNSFDSDKDMLNASFANFSDKFSLKVNGKEITKANLKHVKVNSKTGASTQVITSTGSEVIINGKKY
ncbi:MAG: hypothetical protein RLZZ381_1482 [Cyanobacteriota bacterium]|jgi:hypothetical protein